MRIAAASSAAVAALLLAAAPGAAAQRCLEKYQCRFHHDINGVEYSWDLSPLCKDGPETSPPRAWGDPVNDYMVVINGNQNITFNICAWRWRHAARGRRGGATR